MVEAKVITFFDGVLNVDRGNIEYNCIVNEGVQRDVKRGKFLNFIWIGKMKTPLDCVVVGYIYKVKYLTPPFKKPYREIYVETTIDNSKLNYK